jgi:hypothetical protein
MRVSKEDFSWVVSQGMISAEQAASVWNALESRDASRPRFDMANVMYYFGALIVMSAMGCFMTLGWEIFGGGGILLISVVYALCFVLAGRTLWFKQKLIVPGGLLFVMAVCMTPLAIYGLERLVGFWPQGDPGTYRDFHVWVKGGWFFMEVATILAALVALWFIRFPFLTAPIAFSLWYMSMDLTPLLFGRPEFTWNERLWVSVWFGLAMLLVSYLVDRRTKGDYAFWGYLFGMLAFWFGLSLMENGGELSKFFYCLINLGLMLVSVLLQRRVFIIFGSFGVLGYLGYLSYHVFQNSLLFPVALSFIGILVIYLGIKYQHNQVAIERFIFANIPPSIKRMLPMSRRVR